MYKDLNAVLNLSNSDNLPQNMVITLFDDVSFDSCVFLHHFVSHALKMDSKAIICSFTQIQSHFNFAHRKLGNNLIDKIENNQLLFINGLDYVIDTHFNANGLLRAISGFCQNESVCITVDDFSLLVELGVDHKQILYFFKKLCDLNGQLIVQMHSDIGYIKNENILQKYALYKSNVIINSKSLSTGRCKEIDGQLVIGPGQDNTLGLFPTTVHFKVFDSNIKVFPMGL